MPPPTSVAPPGSMTVPFLFQGEVILAVVAIALVLAVVALVVQGARPGTEERDEWQAWLGARSRRTGGDPGEQEPAGRVRA